MKNEWEINGFDATEIIVKDPGGIGYLTVCMCDNEDTAKLIINVMNEYFKRNKE